VRRSIVWLVGVLVLAAAGFAVASIAGGGSDVGAQVTTGSTSSPGQTVTVTVTQTTTVSKTAKVTICHRTGRKRPFAVTVKVSASSLFAHFRHGDLPGRCTAAKIKKMKSGKRR
jgi:hypothetical protein